MANLVAYIDLDLNLKPHLERSGLSQKANSGTTPLDMLSDSGMDWYPKVLLIQSTY